MSALAADSRPGLRGGALLICLGLSLFGQAAAAQEAPRAPGPLEVASRVDEYVQPYLRMQAFAGTILVARQGEVLVSRGYGYADLGGELRASPSTIYGLGSIAKTLTAAAVVLLAEQGQLALTDPVSAHLAEFGPEDGITIANLLEHSSGLRDYYSWSIYRTGRQMPISQEAFLARAVAEPLDFAPGSQSAYSNTGYFVLAAIVERVSGLPFDEFIRRYLFEPLGMNASGSFEDGRTADGLATGYDPGFPPTNLQPAESVSATWLAGSGSVYSTAPDMHRWLSAIRDHALVDLDRLPYPYGWGKHTRLGRDVLEQNGRIPTGYASYAGLYPAEDVVVVVLGNIQAEVTQQMGVDIAAIALGEPYEIPEVRPRADRPDSSVLQTYAGCYEIAPGFDLTVRAVEEGLLLAGPDGAFLPLDYEGGDAFFFRPLWVPVSFVRDGNGRPSWLDWNGQFEAERTSSATSDSTAVCSPL